MQHEKSYPQVKGRFCGYVDKIKQGIKKPMYEKVSLIIKIPGSWISVLVFNQLQRM
jgi:hypothetical protein